jgi:imidazolonepropionase-like amidohydrolase
VISPPLQMAQSCTSAENSGHVSAQWSDRRCRCPQQRRVHLHTRHPWAEAFAIRDGAIVAVGSDAEVGRWIGGETHIVDAGAATIMPGVVDVHTHVGFGGQAAA